MSTPGIATVAAWRPGELAGAADRLVVLAAEVGDDARAVRRHLAGAVDDAGGAWAESARGRADQEARRGEALAGALTEAAGVLLAGAGALGAAREALLEAVGRARVAGLTVADDGTVLPPPVATPPPSAPVGDPVGWYVAPEQVAARRAAEELRAAHQAEVAGALARLDVADRALADALGDVDRPETLPSLVAAHQARTHLLGDPVAALGAAGGPLVVAGLARDGRTAWVRGRRVEHYAALVRAGAPAEEVERARRAIVHGTATGPVLKVLGRASMPLTMVSGVSDTWTGGGYDGARGWATRGFAAAGTLGAGVLLVAGTPALVVAGGTAVIAYGLWSAGNYAVDHWDQVEDAWEAADAWVLEQQVAAAGELEDALAWAGEQLAGAGTTLAARAGLGS